VAGADTTNSVYVECSMIHGIKIVWIPGGTFQMGNEDGIPIEKPVHNVKISSFYISAYEITNRQYAEFLKQMNYSFVVVF